MQNYRMDYGFAGIPLAAAHLALLGAFDHIVAMTEAMAVQVKRYARRMPAVIGNFVDEGELEPFRAVVPSEGPYRFVFVGSLTHRKQPLLLIKAAHELHKQGVTVYVDLVGDGPLRSEVADQVARRGLTDLVRLHGHLANPYTIVARADAMVLPSLSEGLSRSSLEALYLGVPCVLRDVDGNRELIHDGRNGVLFRQDQELPGAMLAGARLARSTPSKTCLLPGAFREREAARKYLELVEAI